jgi:hypothetical protein
MQTQTQLMECDDHGTDICDATATTVATSSSFILAAKGRGNDGTKPEDDGVDPADPCDDHGDDGLCV